LHAAIQEALAQEPALTVRFNVTGRIQLASPLPVLGKRIVIDGPGAEMLTVLAPPNGPVFEVSGPAEIRGLTVSGGTRAGIRVIDDGALTATRVTVAENVAGDIRANPTGVRFNDGGGIFNRGILTVVDSLIAGNTAHIGAGIFNSGILRMTGSTVSDNTAGDDPRGSASGGGITTGGTATITSSRVVGNRAGNGGGIYTSGELTVENSEIADNVVPAGAGVINHGGGIYVTGTARIRDSVIARNTASYGGGIFKSPEASLAITGTSITSNRAGTSGGGIINNRGTLTLERSTIANNEGEGLSNNRGTATLINVTVSGNGRRQGSVGINNTGVGGDVGVLKIIHGTITGNQAGLRNDGVSQVTLRATILQGNPSANCTGRIISEGANISSDGTCNLTGPGDRNRTNALLGPLGDNGGKTQTHALSPESLAIDAAGLCDVPVDQRGESRPQPGAPGLLAACDSGSYELQPSAE
jgi:predicted outer membrane repeat protein